jgi:hypothetical protein
MPDLIRDEPYWIILGTGQRSGLWRLRLYRDADDRFTAIITEPDDADGPSITNCADDVVQDLNSRFPGIDVRLIEHYPAGIGVGDEHFDLVILEGKTPRWTRIPIAEMVSLYGAGIVDFGSPDGV